MQLANASVTVYGLGQEVEFIHRCYASYKQLMRQVTETSFTWLQHHLNCF